MRAARWSTLPTSQLSRQESTREVGCQLEGSSRYCKARRVSPSAPTTIGIRTVPTWFVVARSVWKRGGSDRSAHTWHRARSCPQEPTSRRVAGRALPRSMGSTRGSTSVSRGEQIYRQERERRALWLAYLRTGVEPHLPLRMATQGRRLPPTPTGQP